MEELIEISNGYYDLFRKTGRIEFFMRSRNVLRLCSRVYEEEFLAEQDLAMYKGEVYDIEWTL